ncbi:MAG TPA: GDSL-type esterase/lipase family protein, partial [Pirellulales bacterium]|nr:GDSL-type esterase/lipase family protein [Pirellulales bacterium]
MLLTLALWPIVLAAAGSSARAELVLRDGDRVVLLGGTIVEREQLYGYWEAMFVSHFPRASVAFRNLGRSGDTVWGDSRAGSGTADDGFKALIEHVENIKPTLIIVAYGANESLDGEARLGRFQDGLKRLLDRLAATGARIMLLAPLRLEQMPPPLPDPAAQNKQLWHYVEALHDVAVGRDYPFLDFERW